MCHLNSSLRIKTSRPKERHEFRFTGTVVFASSRRLEQGHAEGRDGDEARINALQGRGLICICRNL